MSLGDLGYLDDDGYLFLSDRRTDLILRGGANIYPAEVEAALVEHPAVRDAVVLGLPCEDYGARSEEHTSELQSLMRISYAVFCLKKKKKSPRSLVTKDTWKQDNHNSRIPILTL